MKHGGLYIGKQPNQTSITPAEAVEKWQGKYGVGHPSIHVEVDRTEGDNDVVHAYPIVMGDEDTRHTATCGWYYVNQTTGNSSSVF